jgi:hypothetical protein
MFVLWKFDFCIPVQVLAPVSISFRNLLDCFVFGFELQKYSLQLFRGILLFSHIYDGDG